MTTYIDQDYDDTKLPPTFSPEGESFLGNRHAGAKKVEFHDSVITPIRIEYTVRGKGEVFFPVLDHHKALILVLQKYAPELSIVPVNANITDYNNMDQFPTTKEDFDQHFVSREEKQTGAPRKVVVCMTVRSATTINDIKFRNPGLLQYLKQESIFIKPDKFNRCPLAKIGFLLGIPIQLINRDSLRFKIRDFLSEMTLDAHLQAKYGVQQSVDDDDASENWAIPQFELLPATRGYGNDQSRITTRVLDIQCLHSESNFLKELFTMINWTTIGKNVQYYPTGLIQMTSPEIYRAGLNNNNTFLNNTSSIVIVGMSNNASNIRIPYHPKPHLPMIHDTILNILASHEGIMSIESTQRTSDLGKWFVVIHKNHQTAVKAFLDINLPLLWERVPKKPGFLLPEFPHPRRSDYRSQQSTSVLNYANALGKSIDTSDTSNVSALTRDKRPNAIQFIYDKSDFPAPKKKARDDKSTKSELSTTDVSSLRESIMTEMTQALTHLVEKETTKMMQACQQQLKDTIKQAEHEYSTTAQHTIKEIKLQAARHELQMNQSAQREQKVDAMLQALCAHLNLALPMNDNQPMQETTVSAIGDGSI